MHYASINEIYYNKLYSKTSFAVILMHYSSKLETMKLKRHALPDCICDHSHLDSIPPPSVPFRDQTTLQRGGDAHHDHSHNTRQIYLLQVTGI
mmetsp:Transcript_12826/g.18405  ORF Transcript_12826/g.18405 Transcript_12826/m.18405 type:complete len:93 (+) Transcript_12826:473-751(+)